mgnify:CR=1 FL=1
MALKKTAAQMVSEARARIEEIDSIEAIAMLDEVYIDERVTGYIVDVVRATRDPASVNLDDLAELIDTGASPRASISLALAARAHAFMAGRAYVTPQDVKSIAHDVMRHRIIVNFHGQADGITADKMIDDVLGKVRPPSE